MTDDQTKGPNTADDKKNRMLGAMTLPPVLPTGIKKPTISVTPPSSNEDPVRSSKNPELPSASKAEQTTADAPNFRKMLRTGQRKDPVAGRGLTEMVRSTYYLSEQESRDFKVLAAINGHSMSELLRSAVQNYIEENRHRLPR